MTDKAGDDKLLPHLRRVMVELQETRTQLQGLERRQHEPIAIVGMSCRYPGGVSSPQDLWDLVAEGRDAIGEFPANRGWSLERLYDPDPDNPGTSYARHGGFLYEAGEFDPAFFGISPREALAMDPQQRLLLEGAWEAFEGAGIDPASLRGSQTGVFAGVMYHDYAAGPQLRAADHEILGGYLGTGTAGSVASGRLAYAFGLEGPAVSVDTACSSSLIAIHLACQELRSGECEMALAGGVSVMATPTTFIDFSRQRGLAPDGRCKSFGADADGTGWGEGVGLVLLERLSEARRKGHRVLGLIRGSAVNQDGASNGLTAPNGPSQERVIAQALADAGLNPQDIDAVEAHGTGTPLGDPIEAQALLATYGKERANGPLWLGSIKSNIGHTQAAAGVAGVIKTIQALEHELLPPTLHAERPSEHVDWSEGAVELLNEPRSWPAGDRPRRAGVSSFGVSGTNAHLILEEAPLPDPSAVDRNGGDPEESSTPALTETTLPWLLSAKTAPALRDAAARLAAHLSANPELKTTDVGNALVGRSAFEHRAVLLGGDRQDLTKALAALAAEEHAEGLQRATASPAGPIVFMFPGQGGQWAGMALELIERSPVFAEKIEECEAALSEHLEGFSIEEALRGEGEDLDRLDVVQPALFSIMVSLAELWRSFGVTPDVVIGHSQGEIAAAHIAGGLSLKDAARVVALRSRALTAIAGKGATAAIAATAEEIASLIESYGERLSLAAINGPTSTVISGEPGALKELLATCEAEGRRTRTLPVDCASHSAQIDQLEAELLEAFAPIEPRSGQIAFHSTLTGSQLDTAELDAIYWYRNLRETVRFEQVSRELIKAGHRTFIELSPHPVLTVGLTESIEAELEDPSAALIAGSLRRNEGGPERFLASAAMLWAKGTEVDWKAAFKATGAKPIPLPTYPFQRERYWFGPRGGTGDMAAAGLGDSEHPLLGATVSLAQGEGALFTGRISLESHPWLADHAVLGRALIPGAAFLELALHAGAELGVEFLEELIVESPLILEEQGAVQIQLTLGEPDEDGRRSFSIHSRPEAREDEEPEWTRHASGYLGQAKEDSLAIRQHAASLSGTWPPEGAEPLDSAGLYERLSEVGLEYGPAFQGLQAAYRRGEELFAELALAEQESAGAGAFGVHPALLDSAFHAVGFEIEAKENPSLPFAFSGARLYASGASALRLCLTAKDAKVSLALADQTGALVFDLDSLSVREVSEAQLGAARDPHRDSLLALRWSPVPQPPHVQEHPDPVLLDFTENAKPEEAQQIASAALAQIQAHLADEDLIDSRLVVLTREAVWVREGDKLTGLAASPLWGLVRSAQSENPGRIVLIDTDGLEISTEALEGALACEELQLAIREGEVLAPRLHRAQPAEERESTQSFDPNRTTLITGATGTLGSLIARHLVEAHGSRHLLLASRQGPEANGATELKAELEALGATVEINACDVSDRSQLEALLAAIPDEHPLGAVIHAAGAIDDATIASLDPERLKRVFAPKLDAAWHLHELTEQMDLTGFVLFSSAAATLGSPGQGNYAAANAFLDSLAAYRQAKGLPASSIAWGLWEEASALTETADRERLSRAGVQAISSQEGLGLFDASLLMAESFAFAAPLDRGALRATAKAGVLPPILAELVRVPTRRSSGRDGLLARRLAETPDAEHKALVLELVSAEIAAVLGHSSATAIDPDGAFKDLGFDSLSAVELRNRLNALGGLSLPATMVFDYPTPAGVAEYLLGELSGAKASSTLPATSVRPTEEPIAIVGMSCRYPGGVSSPEELWDLVANEGDAIGEFPADRDWDVERLYDPDPDNPGTSYTCHGGFLYEAAEFDAAFFGISPREALAMDPQQRLLLEGAWEAFEDAGIDPASLRGSQTGVFAGVMYHDYALFPEARPAELDGYLGTGGSLVSGRLAYSFGFEGPAISVDTACSSSLVAMHLACQALRAGECDRALAGGVTVLYSPAVFTTFSRQRGLAPDGRCKSFGAGADGAGWGEGVGLVLLERLSEARRRGHRVLGLIRGSAVNQDGASNGLTAPNGPSQERVIAQALADAGLAPQDIDAVEAHGTGTPLGDPIEAQALLATYGKERANGPLRLGSIKSNIGHTQAAAGVAGVIKTIQALEHELLPPTLHAERPSEHIDWSGGALELLHEMQSWPAGDLPRRAGVSSFGISGTNAHLILEEAPAADPSASEGGEDPEESPTPPLTETTLPWLLSAKTEPALREAAERLASHLGANPELKTADIGNALAGRSAFEHRAALVGEDREGLTRALAGLATEEQAEGLQRATARPAGPIVFMFPGQGAQWAGMALELIERSPVFAEKIEECEEALSEHLEGFSIKEALRGEGENLDRLDVVQPALFSIMVSLAELWASLGVTPDVVIGHSQGEIAAAHIAGGLSLKDAARVVALRSKALTAIAGKGAMASVAASAEQIAPLIESYGDRLSLAAINGPTSTVISGEPGALKELLTTCEQEGKRTRTLPVDYASHSAQIDQLEAELLEAFAPIEPRSGQIAFHSTLTGSFQDTAELDATYWFRNLRETVRFEQVTRALIQAGHRTFLELSPHPVLTVGLTECVEAELEDPGAALIAGSLRRDEGGPERFLASAAELWTKGAEVDWRSAYAATGAKPTSLPTYPFQRERYWFGPRGGAGDMAAAGLAKAGHPLLGATVPLAEGEGALFTGRISLQSHPWLADHAVLGTTLIPGAAFLELALHAGSQLECPAVEELIVESPLVLEEQGAVQIQLTLGEPDDEGRRSFSIHSRPEATQDEEREWTRHASGYLAQIKEESPLVRQHAASLSGTWPPEGAEPLDSEDLYERLSEAGLEYGPAFQGLNTAYRRGEELFAELSLAEQESAGAGAFGIHPALLDSAFHAVGFEIEAKENPSLPFAFSGARLYASGASSLRLCLTAKDAKVSLALADQSGALVFGLESLSAREVSPAQLGAAHDPHRDSLFALGWSPVPQPPPAQEPPAHVLLDFTEDARPDEAQQIASRALEQIQAHLTDEDLADSRLVVLTKEAVAVKEGDKLTGLASSVLWGLVRSAQSENPGRIALIDTDGSETSTEALASALACEESQLAIRSGELLAPRLSRAGSESLTPPADTPGWNLQTGGKGTFEDLHLEESPGAIAPLGPGQVRVAVKKAGLNFRDVLIALGIYPGEASIGAEGAGTVVEVGEGVEDLRVGDPVMGLLSDAFGPLAVSERDLLAGVPEQWSFAQAASVPIAFLTAYYGLTDLGGLKAGQRVLIHAGTGGVGMAAIQIARHLGAEIYATASPSKWETLRSLGIPEERIASSRDLDFKQRFLEETEGEGVDVVLDSLANEFVDASFELLPRGGHFVEMGKTDVRDSAKVAEEHPGVHYRAFDLMEAGAQRIAQMLTELTGLFKTGALQPLPIREWDIREAPEAFRFMSQARHSGKIVLALPARSFDPNRTTLITGATGTLGSLIARHLVEAHGARHLLLASRQGPEANGATDLKAELEALGATVEINACDVSDRSQLEALLAAIPDEHPLGAVIHAAGAIDDATIASLDPERLKRVFAPKLDAAWHLHELTEQMDLTEFVLFSSAAATLGSPGQGNYAAANAFLDSLAAYRQARGLPASSIAWGLWEEASALTETADRERLSRVGVEAISSGEGLGLFDASLATPESFALAAPLDRATLRAAAKAGVLPPILAELIRVPTRRSSGRDGLLARRLAETPEAEHKALVLELISAEIAAVLGHSSADAINSESSFKDLGFDSLSAVELRNRLNALSGLRLPATLVFDYPTPAGVAEYLLGELSGVKASVSMPAISVRPSEEPIAIVGMSCRYPGGVSSPEELWDLVAGGRDAIGEFPTDRGWPLDRLYDPDPDAPGTSYARHGGFVHNAAEFDAAFFGISPREALAMDPQQRLLLEGAWEAFEDAGIDPASLRGSQTGVFAGVTASEYGIQGTDELEGYRLTGGMGSVASGRLSYAFGLEGPAVSVDTACSSSLVAMHLACQALRSGECGMALAGGATVVSTPGLFVEFARQRGLSPDGRCKSFAEAADGTGFSEGMGLLLLERLSEAQTHGHEVLALIRGSAVNQDGASNGLTAPNGPSQQRVIAQALANARVSAAQVDAVEAHGTGTVLGDPIEAQALLATYGKERANGPLRLGSIKSNIGHSVAAAGVAGVIKMVQALREGALPKTLHIDEPSSSVDWSEGEIELLSEQVPWQPNGEPRRAGVSSFGISGTNAHLILEEAPAADPSASEGGEDPEESPTPPLTETTLPWLLSAKTGPALREAAERLASHLGANPELKTADIGNALAGRSAFEHRAALVGEDREGLTRALAGLATEEQAEGLQRATARPAGPIVFMFPGQGAQWAGMALELIERSPVFAEKIEECEEALSEHLEGFSIKEALRGEGENLDRLDVVQPALFSIMVSLAELWASLGVTPDVVIGHSQGEIAAAHIAGGLSLKDAARVVALRSKALTAIAGKGAMASVAASAEQIAPLIESYGDRLSLAAINGPTSTVISGEPGALKELLTTCEQEGKRTRTLPVDYASHSAQIDQLEAELLEAFAPIEPRSGQIAFHSTLTGSFQDTAELDATYWFRNLRETVRFEQVTRALIQAGHRTFLELSPHPVLTVGLTECVEAELEDPGAALIAGSLRRDEGGPERFLASAAELWTKGAEVDWRSAYAATGAKPTSLPTYPFQRERYWFGPRGGAGDMAAAGLAKAGHPLLGATVPLAEGEGALFTGRISLQSHPWLADHAVLGTTLIPGAAFLELALHAGSQLECPAVEELIVESPLVLEEQGAVQIQLTLGEPDDEGRRSFSIHSRPEATQDEEREWTRHASGYLAQIKEESPLVRQHAASLSGTWPPEGAEPLDSEDLYERLSEAGLEYGPAFQGLNTAYRRGEELFAELSLAEQESAGAGAFGIHPALLDSAFHAVGFEIEAKENPSLPFAFSGARLYASGASSLRLCLTAKDAKVSLALADQSGALVFGLESLSAREVSPAQLGAAHDPHRDSLFALGWSPVPQPPPAQEPPAHVLLDFTEDARPDEAQQIASRALEQIQAHLTDEDLADSRLVVLTKEAVAVKEGDKLTGLASSVLWGLVRSAQSENPGRIALIDTDGSETSTEALASALACEESQLAIRSGELLAPRLSRAGSESLTPPADTPGWNLQTGGKGTFEDLHLEESPGAIAPLGPGQVRVAVKKAGLNFRDVLIALGIYPGEASIGAEGAGTVVEVGEGVEDLRVGDPVMGLLSDAFGPLAVSERDLLAGVPEQWSFAQAASVPIAFLTAYYGLTDLGGLKAGQRVLIHAGTGGVGMAAIQIARHLGAEIYATASPSKWETLRSLGIPEERIASSRDLDFKQRFLEETEGEGVDVVLDSLANEFVDASFELLPRGGHFVEMGKTDVRDSAKVAEEHPGVHYRAFDLMEAGAQRIAQMLTELTGLFKTGALQPLPIREWDIREAPEAFRFMSQARHSGKIVLALPARSFDPNRTTLITGATGTLGSLIARHLVEAHGARHLLLASRQGPEANGATDLKAELEALGATVEINACDVSDRSQLEALLAAIPDEHPLGAVIHAAGAIDDATIASLDPERLKRVFAPKLDAAWHLHELTEQMDLTEFVLFSSAAATLGSPGQGNYAAANAFLDSLAAYRQARGLPASSIAWGLWEEASALTETADRERLSRVGVEAISSGEGLGLFDASLATPESFALAAPLDRATLRAAAKAGVLPPILAELIRVPTRRSSGRDGLLARRLAETPEAEHKALVLELISAEIAAVLGHSSADAINSESSFKDLGFDSLSAVELRNRLNALSGLRLPATLVFDYPTPVGVAEYLLAGLSGVSRSEDLGLDGGEQAIRGALASIPLDRLREAGLTDLLLKMASQYAGPSLPEDGKGVDLNSIDTMDLDKLVARTLEGSVADEAVGD